MHINRWETFVAIVVTDEWGRQSRGWITIMILIPPLYITCNWSRSKSKLLRYFILGGSTNILIYWSTYSHPPTSLNEFFSYIDIIYRKVRNDIRVNVSACGVGGGVDGGGVGIEAQWLWVCCWHSIFLGFISNLQQHTTGSVSQSVGFCAVTNSIELDP